MALIMEMRDEQGKQQPGQQTCCGVRSFWEWLKKTVVVTRGMRLFLKWASVVYVAGLVLLLAYLDRYGGSGSISGFFLFIPPFVWLVPMVALLPLSAFLYPRACWLYAVAIMLSLAYTYKNAGGHPIAGQEDLVILSNNLADRTLNDFWKFFDEQKPDIAALQYDYMLNGVGRVGFYKTRVSEFGLFSKYPIMQSEGVPGMVGERGFIAARFVVDFKGQPIAIYSVHMPTPRWVILGLYSDTRPFSTELGKVTVTRNGAENYSRYWERRRELNKILLDALEMEKLPFIVVGDFNMPDHGVLYREWRSCFQDVFTECGKGTGLSFPGGMDPFFKLRGPWFRIDYQFCGKEWLPLSLQVESCKTAKHLALVGRYHFVNKAETPK